ncbi:hypothetical protein A3K64_01125 [Candidatus Micrarchaeota archaeon RBG_16_36_9]|nr:MAG: hypothetical protein A3K64_01125 [Candidatus Micrarchaeota archaeon RBG_16_36_9]
MTFDPLAMVCPPGAGCPFTTGFGIAEILLWVLAFAISFAVLEKSQLGKKAGTLVAIVISFLVVMTVPTALIGFVASMSTGLVTLAIGALILISILMLAKADGEYSKYGKYVGYILIAVVILMFVNFGGLALIGLTTLPAITPVMVIIALVGIAVLWMLSADKPENPTPTK